MLINNAYTPASIIPFGKSGIDSADVNNQTTALNNYVQSIDDQRASAVITSNTTLIANRDIFNPVNADAGNFTITLPAVADHTTQPIRIFNRGLNLPAGSNGQITIKRAGSDTILNPFNFNASGSTLKMVIPGECFEFYPVSAGVWGVMVINDGASNFPTFHVNRTADLNNAGTYFPIDWTVKSSTTGGFEAWDDGSYFNLTTDRYTPTIGVKADFVFGVQSYWSAGTSSNLNTYLVKNENTPLSQGESTTASAFGVYRKTEIEMNGTTDYFTSRVGSFGATRTLIGSAGNRYLFFEGRMVGRKE